MNPKRSQAISLRKQGLSYPDIERSLHVSRSTIHSWLKDVALSRTQKQRLENRKLVALGKARILAATSHKNRRLTEMTAAEEASKQVLENISWTRDLKLTLLAMLYLGEGFKMRSYIGLGNSRSDIMQCYVNLLREIFNVPNEKLKGVLYLRADQDHAVEIQFWSHTLKIPTTRFGKSQFDQRTLGKKTRLGYHGVCAVYCYDATIEKQLTAMQKHLLLVINKGG